MADLPVTALRSWLSRVLAPNLGRCYRCKTSLFGPIRNEEHTTYYAPGQGCFPLCERCWSSLTPAERLPYYDALVETWINCAGSWADRAYFASVSEKRALIREAVLAGG
jgi:hypothetical protein